MKTPIKVFSMRRRQRYMLRSKLMAALRFALGGITAGAPHQSAEGVDEGDDLGSQATARAADGLVPGSAPGATRLLMGGDDGAVDQGVFEVRFARQAREDALKDAAFHPATEPLEDAVPAAEVARQIAPRCPGPKPPQHRLQE